ncbi:MAG TPA: hypothetical protein DCF49_09805 [Lachnospiraceae bacterium]|nr:hypothetical protein [Lachnospiraceae bacterium]
MKITEENKEILNFSVKSEERGAGASFSGAVRNENYGEKQENLEFLRKIRRLTIQTAHLKDRYH